MALFSERELGPRPRTSDVISENCWKGIVSVLQARINDGSFGQAYPLTCPDGNDVYDVAMRTLENALVGHNLPWPWDVDALPFTFDTLDLLEFCYEKVAKPQQDDYHSYYRHYHLSFDGKKGKIEFREEINRIFARNQIAYELGVDGKIIRLAPAVVGEALGSAIFKTGDRLLDELLESSRTKFLQPKLAIRKEALEKLWDAWERLKTLDGKDKKASIAAILDKASPEPNFRTLLESEAKVLTEVGNRFTIRHTEVGKIEIDHSEHVDYLFHRMFGMIRLLLRATERGG